MKSMKKLKHKKNGKKPLEATYNIPDANGNRLVHLLCL